MLNSFSNPSLTTRHVTHSVTQPLPHYVVGGLLMAAAAALLLTLVFARSPLSASAQPAPGEAPATAHSPGEASRGAAAQRSPLGASQPLRSAPQSASATAAAGNQDSPAERFWKLDTIAVTSPEALYERFAAYSECSERVGNQPVVGPNHSPAPEVQNHQQAADRAELWACNALMTDFPAEKALALLQSAYQQGEPRAQADLMAQHYAQGFIEQALAEARVLLSSTNSEAKFRAGALLAWADQ